VSTWTGAQRMRQGIALALLAAGLLLLLRTALGVRLERADFVFNNGAEITTLDPATVTGIPEGKVLRAIFEGLVVKHPETLEPLPGMAESWTVSDDGLTYEFKIREGAVWTNGDPVTADDFAWSWERFLNPATAAEYAYQLWYVKGAREYTRMADDRLYGHGEIHHHWAKDMGDGSWRVGVSGFVLEDLDPAGPVRPELGPGDAFENGDCFVDFDEGHFHVYFEGRVVRVNPDLPATVGELLEDPYEAGWILEVRPDEGSIERNLAEGDLLTATDSRAEYMWPYGVGVHAWDDTLVVELENPTPYFLDLVGFYPLFPVNRRGIEEAKERWPETWRIEWLRPENLVTNGPFRVAERRINDRIRLAKSPTYWDADNVAFDTIDVLAVENYVTMLNLYLTGEVDWIDRVSSQVVTRMLGREDFQPRPYLGSYFYRVNVTRPPMDDVRVRRALALSMDRRAIAQRVAKSGQIPSWSFAPLGMRNYVNAEMEHAPLDADRANYDAAFATDVETAKALLAEAGYGPDNPLPTFEILYNTSELHRDIAEVVADGWRRHLGLDAKLLNQEWKVYLDSQSNLAYDVCRAAWIGDYADPNTFLDMFVTDGENNKTGWGNPEYDARIAAAIPEPDAATRMQLLPEAEAIFFNDTATTEIYTYVTQNMWRPRLGGFEENLLDEHFPKFWYWMSDEELAAKRAAQDPSLELVEPGGPR
jgi:oligopeptide transport system substrate-binding protein